MPLDVIMPALGMAQETGVIVAWHKKPGDAVAEGDVLFEVETDKATMEVEAQAAGYLSGVTAGEGDEVPVGDVIARISDNADEPAEAAPDTDAPDPADGLPDGQEVIMPTLGMAQDSGLLVGWLVEAGAAVTADDPLFEVETDKSTVEVPAGVDGYLAACLARPGDEVPTGQVIAIVSAERPQSPVMCGMAEGAPPPQKANAEAPAAKPVPAPQGPPAAAPAVRPAADPSGHLLASPKARRLALEQGLDLGRLAEAGYPQPYHAKDIETLKALPADTAPGSATAPAAAAASMHLTAEIPAEGFSAFAAWAAKEAGLDDAGALMAALAGNCLSDTSCVVALDAFGTRRLYAVVPGALGGTTQAEDAAPDLILRDLRMTRITGLRLGAEEAPVLSLASAGAGLALTLECAPGRMSPDAALSLLSDFAGRLEQPLRHLL